MLKNIYRRNIEFKRKVAKIPRERLLGVAIDPSKHFNRVIIFDFTGKLISPPFSADVMMKGYKEFRVSIEQASIKTDAKSCYIAVEGPSPYSENFVRHLIKDYKNVVKVTSNAVALNRGQKSLQGLKTDDIDAGAIGDLLIRGEFSEFNFGSSIYSQLNKAVYWRHKRISFLRALKNQISARVMKVFPGLNTDYSDYKKLFTRPNDDFLYRGILNFGLTGKQLLKTKDNRLIKIFGYGTSPCGIGPHRIKNLKDRLRAMLLPDERVAKIELVFLKKDVALLRYLEHEIENIEKKIISLGKRTCAKYIMNQISGIDDLSASLYIGLIGDITKYKSASAVYSFSGLCPKVSQSGQSKIRGLGIKRAGNRVLRSVLFQLATQVIVHEPIFMDYYNNLRGKGKLWKKSRIAVANKLNRTLFALIRDRAVFKRSENQPP